MPLVGSGGAYGWSVASSFWKGFGYQWSAYGPNGGTMGRARTKEEAERQARAALDALKAHAPASTRKDGDR